MSVSTLTGHTSVMEANNRIFGFSENVDFCNFPMGFGVWEGLQSIENACGLQMDGFSPHFEPYRSIWYNFYVFDGFGVDSGGLTLTPEGPTTLRECLEVPGPCETVLCWSDASSARFQDPPRLGLILVFG